MGKTTQHNRRETFIKRKQLLERWGISAMTLERRLKTDPQTPRPIRFDVGPRAVRFWRLSEIEAYERMKAGRAA
jgi:predicted DNA-binding transcriptional regulator AlpA